SFASSTSTNIYSPIASATGTTMQTSLSNNAYASSINSTSNVNTEVQVSAPSTTKRRFFAKRNTAHQQNAHSFITHPSNGLQGSSDTHENKISSQITTSTVPTNISNNSNTPNNNGIMHSSNNHANGILSNGVIDIDFINFNDSNE
ncbi:904_t:CDS:1, partial [Scutellospora calospora]